MKTRPTKITKAKRLCITIPTPLFDHLSKLSMETLQMKSLSGLVMDALIEKYGKKFATL